MARILEIRTYTLKPGMGDEFQKLVHDISIPMVRRAGIDVVRFGASLHSTDGYFLIRSFDSLEDHRRQEDAFYTSDEWLHGPRAAIMACIDSYSDLVIELDTAVVDALRN
jgi:hypothetical protein